MTGFVDSYFKALLAHDARALPQAAQARITENGAEKQLATTFWDSGAETVFRFDVVNIRRGDTGTEAVIRNADGTIGYDPTTASAIQKLAQGVTATDTFKYSVKDEFGRISTTTVTITLSGRNDAPVANANSASVSANATVSIQVLKNDTDVDAGAVLQVILELQALLIRQYLVRARLADVDKSEALEVGGLNDFGCDHGGSP